VPPPPTPQGARPVAPGASGIQQAIESSRLSVGTIYKLQIGGLVLLFLLMCLLPAPRDPLAQSLSERLAFPGGAFGGHILGADQLGRDVLSRMMSGGRFLVFRLVVVGAIALGLAFLARRQLRQRTGRNRLTAPTLVLITTCAMAASVSIETVLGFFGTPPILRLLGPIGRILLGVPATTPAASWGGMLAAGREVSTQAPWLLLIPLVGLLVVAVGLVALGSGIADVLRQRARIKQSAETAFLPGSR
jgi:ABC-type dipeptide/oligopeptide/nickel transport system permease subunit